MCVALEGAQAMCVALKGAQAMCVALPGAQAMCVALKGAQAMCVALVRGSRMVRKQCAWHSDPKREKKQKNKKNTNVGKVISPVNRNRSKGQIYLKSK